MTAPPRPRPEDDFGTKTRTASWPPWLWLLSLAIGVSVISDMVQPEHASSWRWAISDWIIALKGAVIWELARKEWR